MQKTIHVHRKENETYEVHVEIPPSPEMKVSGRFLDASRLQEELVRHGCTPEQIEKGMGELDGQKNLSAIIPVD